MGDTVLSVNNLKTYFFTDNSVVPAVDGVSFNVSRGETLGIVGESGSGKSVTSLSILKLIAQPPGKIVDGSIIFNGEDIIKKNEEEMRHIRGNNISMIFQEPMTSLNPVYTIGKQITESIVLHQKLSKKDALNKAIDMLRLVKVPLPEKRVKQYPHQLSGGMRQRVMIAIALSCNPELLIADEPTTALDVTIQAQILEILKQLKKDIGMSVILITHDLGVVAEMADNVMVMYCGRIIEYSNVSKIFNSPYHPYTIGLLNSMPQIKGKKKKLYTIKGTVPLPNEISNGCRFKTRCDDCFERCLEEEPPLFSVGESKVRCWKYFV